MTDGVNTIEAVARAVHKDLNLPPAKPRIMHDLSARSLHRADDPTVTPSSRRRSRRCPRHPPAGCSP